MPRAKHKVKKPKREDRDFAQVAFDVVQQTIARSETTEHPKKVKNPAAVELGSKGGKARAERLSAARRKAIARKAARKRWSDN